MKECGVFEVGAFDDGVNRARFLAETAEDALGHIDVILSSTARAVRSRLRFNGNGEGRASSFTELACDASLLTGGISSQCVLSTEHWT